MIQKVMLIKSAIIILIIATGYYLKGVPMAVALAMGAFIILKFKRKPPEAEQEFEEDPNNNS